MIQVRLWSDTRCARYIVIYSSFSILRILPILKRKIVPMFASGMKVKLMDRIAYGTSMGKFVGKKGR